MTLHSVYIVDDKKITRESLARTIDWTGKGFQVVGMAGDGITAEEEIRKLRPDIIITDIRMPGRDGLELSSRIHDFLPDSKIIIITGFDKFEYAQKSLRVGAIDIILKPINNQDIEEALKKAKDILLTEKKTAISSDEGFSIPVDETDFGHLTRAVIIYIEENFGEEISLSTLSDMYRVTPSHLSRIFKKETGTTFLKYLNSRRIEKAKEMLLDPRFRISEIAETCGFRTPLHFTKVFKDSIGSTPRDFRRFFSRKNDKKGE